MKASDSSTPARPLLTLEQRQQAFRDLVHESTPLNRRMREIGIEQIELAYEINLEIAQRAFPNLSVEEAEPTPHGEVLPDDVVQSPHDIPRKQSNRPPLSYSWNLATLVPTDDGNAARTICEYLKAAEVEPTMIVTQHAQRRVLLVR